MCGEARTQPGCTRPHTRTRASAQRRLRRRTAVALQRPLGPRTGDKGLLCRCSLITLIYIYSQVICIKEELNWSRLYGRLGIRRLCRSLGAALAAPRPGKASILQGTGCNFWLPCWSRAGTCRESPASCPARPGSRQEMGRGPLGCKDWGGRHPGECGVCQRSSGVAQPPCAALPVWAWGPGQGAGKSARQQWLQG